MLHNKAMKSRGGQDAQAVLMTRVTGEAAQLHLLHTHLKTNAHAETASSDKWA